MNTITIKSPKIKQRITWGFNPITRVIKNKKAYNRKKIKINKTDY